MSAPAAPAVANRAFAATETVGLPDGPQMLFGFGTSRIQVWAGCNQMTARYLLDGTSLTVHDLVTTAAGCAPAAHERDRHVREMLAAPLNLFVTADGVVISSDSIRITAAEEPDDDPQRRLIPDPLPEDVSTGAASR